MLRAARYGKLQIEQKNRFVQYQYIDWIDQTSPLVRISRQQIRPLYRAYSPSSSKHRLLVSIAIGQVSLERLLADDEVVELETLLVLLLDLANDRAEVLNVLKDE